VENFQFFPVASMLRANLEISTINHPNIPNDMNHVIHCPVQNLPNFIPKVWTAWMAPDLTGNIFLETDTATASESSREMTKTMSADNNLTRE
jgi:hypothetical protein